MKYFGTKQVAEVDEDAIAVERLMAIAGRIKAAHPVYASEDGPVDGQEPPKAAETPN
jgi:hypothetical protein